MFRTSIRRFGSTAYRRIAAATISTSNEALTQAQHVNPYGLKVSSAQGTVNGLVGGML